MRTKPLNKSTPVAKPVTGSPSHELRIIGGQWKRSKIKVIDKPGLRPTPDRVRETLFNWLGQDLTDWRCVDAFAGTGALGFEAASRGAKSVLMLEQDAQLVGLLSETQKRLSAGAVQVQKGDAMMALQRLAPNSMDVIFLDPPFESSHFEKALLASAQALVPGGWVYLEAPLAWQAQALAACGLQLVKYMKAGAVHAHLLQRPVEG
ncbi:MAG: Ribosomal small subunit methyltransferase [Pseudomonadota bacterium]|jgi:16S rRNA (guanine966-N2)-methyltransferase